MIQLESVSRVFDTENGQVAALDNVDFRMSEGDYISLVGSSGAGKSTLLKVLGFLDRPSAGNYSLHGSSTALLDDTALAQLRNRKIGFVFQTAHFVEHLNLLDNVALPCTYGMQCSDGQDRARMLLERVGLGHRLKHRPSQLSGGERQRGVLARALIRQPSLLLADEPTGNLDDENADRVARLLEEFNDEGLAILLVTHDTTLAARASRCFRMQDGGILQ